MSREPGRPRRKPAGRLLVSTAQRALFSFEQFARHEMANHAAAGAYAFLLSAVPALLVIAYLTSLAAVRLDLASLVAPLASYLDAFGGLEALKAIAGRPIAGIAGVVGLVNLIWAARLFVVSLQRGVRVVYSDAFRAGKAGASSAKPDPLRDNLLPFAFELLVIFGVVLILAASQLAGAALDAIRWVPAAAVLGAAVRLGIEGLPFLALLAFVFLTYLQMPPEKPKASNAAFSAILCMASYAFAGWLLGLTMDVARYGLIYGIIGNLIVGLIKVYFFFWLYFLCMEMCYTLEHFDSLLFARFSKVAFPERKAGKLERALFAKPERLWRRYAREYRAGSRIFAKGDEDRSALFLYRGSVAIRIPGQAGYSDALVSRIGEGDFFGEMASILDEPRSADAVAETDCVVFSLPPLLFRRYLGQDAEASARMMELLASRLKANNERLTKEGGA